MEQHNLSSNSINIKPGIVAIWVSKLVARIPKTISKFYLNDPKSHAWKLAQLKFGMERQNPQWPVETNVGKQHRTKWSRFKPQLAPFSSKDL